MKKLLKDKSCATFLVAGLTIVFAAGLPDATAQEEATPVKPNPQVMEPAGDAATAEFVTINVKDANIAEVLKAYSLQTGQSIVVGPDVVSDNVNVRLNNIPWEEALDVILKPYGFGYRVVGDTIVISKLENIVTVEGIEPLVSEVFHLKYLDAYNIKSVCEAQLSPRGKISIPSNKGLPRWEFGGGQGAVSGASRSQSTLGVMKRDATATVEKSKTLIITDVPSVVTRIEDMLEELDQMPLQVLIESRFIEIDAGALQDFGFDFATGVTGLVSTALMTSNGGNDVNRWGVEQNSSAGLTPSAFIPDSDDLAGSLPYNAGLQLLFTRVGGENLQAMIHAMQEDGDYKLLSAPRVLTQNNQEAAILVGEKFPIIESQNTSSGVGGATTSTSLKYYENIGIQLNVIPQVCSEGYISMIVHPVVSQIDGYERGEVTFGSEENREGLTRYPILKVREAQTQVLIKSADTVAIGGLQNDIEQKSIYKVPLLGDIPFIGRFLFSRETTRNKEVELVILIKATIIDNAGYATQSALVQQRLESQMTVMESTAVIEEEPVELVEEPVEPVVEAVEETEPVVVAPETEVEVAPEAEMVSEEAPGAVEEVPEPTPEDAAEVGALVKQLEDNM